MIKLVVWTLLGMPILYVGSCAFISATKSDAFDLIKIGDLESDVIRVLGTPSVKETVDEPFTTYISRPCTDDCNYRIWYENHLSLDMEAWFVEFSSEQRVVRKAKLHSP